MSPSWTNWKEMCSRRREHHTLSIYTATFKVCRLSNIAINWKTERPKELCYKMVSWDDVSIKLSVKKKLGLSLVVSTYMLKHRSHNCLIQIGTDEVRAENVTQVPSVVITTQYSDTWPYPQFVIITIRWEPSSVPTTSEKLKSGADITYTD